MGVKKVQKFSEAAAIIFLLALCLASVTSCILETTEISNTTDTTESTDPTETTTYVEYVPPISIPVFMYHTSSEDNPGDYTEYYVKPSEFEKQVQYLIESGFMPLEELRKYREQMESWSAISLDALF